MEGVGRDNLKASVRSEEFVVKVIGRNIGSPGKTDGEIAKSTANITKEYWNRVTGYIGQFCSNLST